MNDGQRVHVLERLQAGDSQADMVRYLCSEGVDEAVATTAVSEVARSLTPTAPQGTLPTISELLAESWQFVKRRTDLVGWYLLVSLLPILVVGLLAALSIVFVEAAPAVLSVIGILGLVIIVATIWFMVTAVGGLFYAVAQPEPTRFLSGWRWARPQFLPILLLGLTASLVMFSSFLLFIIPAFIVLVYNSFYFLEFIRHNHRGLHALAASTQLVYGRFWSIAARAGSMMVLLIVVNAVLTIAFTLSANGNETVLLVGEVVNGVVGLFLTIMLMRFMALLHTAAIATQPEYQLDVQQKSYRVYQALLWGAVGVFVIVIGLFIASAQLLW